MDDLIAFVRAQLDDDERVARTATSGPWVAKRADDSVYAVETSIVMGGHDGGWYIVPAQVEGGEGIEPGDAQHIARWEPARVLAEVDARRVLLARLEGLLLYATSPNYAHSGIEAWATDTLKQVAQPYRGRSGWREEWQA
jgi:hypothetical protein